MNEGTFGRSNGEISFFDRSSKQITNLLFTKVNNNRTSLGDQVQSMHVTGERAYIIASNSQPNQVEIVDKNTFQSLGVIGGLRQPRYMESANGKGYLSEWVTFGSPDGGVAVVDLQTNAVTKRIKTGVGPDRMLLLGGKLYVTQQFTPAVAIIDLATETVVGTVPVPEGSRGIQADRNGDVWVLTVGKQDFSNFPEVKTVTPSSLIRFTPNGNSLTQRATFALGVAGADHLVTNGDKTVLYYRTGTQVFQQSIGAAALNAAPLIRRDLYGIGFDPVENVLYGGFAPDFTTNGRIIRYNATTGAPLDSATAGIAPREFVFQ